VGGINFEGKKKGILQREEQCVNGLVPNKKKRIQFKKRKGGPKRVESRAPETTFSTLAEEKT